MIIEKILKSLRPRSMFEILKVPLIQNLEMEEQYLFK